VVPSGYIFQVSSACTMSAGASNWGYAPGYPNNGGTLYTGFRSNITLTNNNPWTGYPQDIYLDTVSRTYWGGQIPWNADSIQNCDTWTASGWAMTGVTFSLPAGGGVGFSPITNGYSYCPDAITGQQSWNVYNYTYGIHVQGYSLNGFTETSTYHINLGGSWWANTASYVIP